MSSAAPLRYGPPQAFISSYAPRLRAYGNSLIQPIVPPASNLPAPRTTKRGTAIISYAEDGYDEEFDESEEGGPRRPTGLRSRPQKQDDAGADKANLVYERGKELHAPVDIQGIWRDWMGKPKRTALYATVVLH